MGSLSSCEALYSRGWGVSSVVVILSTDSSRPCCGGISAATHTEAGTMKEFEDEDDSPPTQAEVAHRRALELVIRDHAREVWGNLRAIDQLDSHTAEEILMEGMQRLLAKAKATKIETVKERGNTLLQAAKKLRSVVVALWGETGNGQGSLHSLKTCRICSGVKSAHKPDCPVKAALLAAKNAGLGGD